MVKKHMGRCMTLLVIREMQIKTSEIFTLYSLGWLESKSLMTTVGKDIKKPEPY